MMRSRATWLGLVLLFALLATGESVRMRARSVCIGVGVVVQFILLISFLFLSCWLTHILMNDLFSTSLCKQLLKQLNPTSGDLFPQLTNAALAKAPGMDQSPQLPPGYDWKADYGNNVVQTPEGAVSRGYLESMAQNAQMQELKALEDLILAGHKLDTGVGQMEYFIGDGRTPPVEQPLERRDMLTASELMGKSEVNPARAPPSDPNAALAERNRLHDTSMKLKAMMGEINTIKELEGMYTTTPYRLPEQIKSKERIARILVTLPQMAMDVEAETRKLMTAVESDTSTGTGWEKAKEGILEVLRKGPEHTQVIETQATNLSDYVAKTLLALKALHDDSVPKEQSSMNGGYTL